MSHWQKATCFCKIPQQTEAVKDTQDSKAEKDFTVVHVEQNYNPLFFEIRPVKSSLASGLPD